MPDRRTQLAEAAVAEVAEKGLTGLTHRAVDAAASVPLGTTSNYFRTRAALVSAVLDRLERQDREAMGSLGAPGAPASIEVVADRLAGAVITLTQQHAVLTKACLTLLDQPQAVSEGHSDGLILHALTARRGEPLDRGDISATVARMLTRS